MSDGGAPRRLTSAAPAAKVSALVRSVEAVARPAGRPVLVGGVLALTVVAGALVTYKAGASMKAYVAAEAAGTMVAKPGWLDTGDLSAWSRPLAGALNYFGWVMIALAFGVVIAAMVRAFVPTRWLAATISAPGPRGPLLAAMVGTPLMLCSCCVAPIFDGVYRRTRRLGPALTLMFASPALNPAALGLTFLLFPTTLAVGRLVAGLVLVFAGSAFLGHALPIWRRARNRATLRRLWAVNFHIIARIFYPWFLMAPQFLQMMMHALFFGLSLALMYAAAERRVHPAQGAAIPA